jgi:2-polyprenyl-3-methyl-5-hydroxy-6-metoxy-1,4-benzoquinol methylase
MAKNAKAWDRHLEGTDYQFATKCLELGPWTSYSLLHDPKHMCFVLSRYKFCAKLLEGKQSVLEIGCGDGFGLPIVAQSVGHLDCIDWDERLILDNKKRLGHLKNVQFRHLDLNREVPAQKYDAAFSIDVLEHLDPDAEPTLMMNTCLCLEPDGILIQGTPNITAQQYASPQSASQHINLKSHLTLRELLQRYFKNVFIFSMNDEVVHTGYGAMAHYLFGVGVGLKA